MANNILVRTSVTLTCLLSTCLEIVLSLSLTISLAPILLFFWTLNGIARGVISVLLKFRGQGDEESPPFGGRIQLVGDGADGIWGYQKPGNSRNILVLYVYNSKLDLGTFRKNFQERVMGHLSPGGSRTYDKFKRIFIKAYGYYAWRESIDFRLEDHVRHLFPDDPQALLKESELLVTLETLIHDMSEDRPQWEELIVPRFQFDGDSGEEQRSVRICRYHHAYMDGCSNLLFAANCMMSSPGEEFPYLVDPLAPIRLPLWKICLYYLTCLLIGATTVVKNLYSASQLNSKFLLKNYSGRQHFTWSDPISLCKLKEIKDSSSTGIPVILSCITGGALKKLVETCPTLSSSPTGHGGPGEGTLKDVPLGVVGAQLPYPDTGPRNRFTVVNFSVSTGDPCRAVRLRRTQKRYARLLRSPDGLINYIMFKIFGKFPAWVISLMMNGAGLPALYTNVPWASSRIRLWGDEVEEIAGFMPLLTTAGVGILTVSYCDKMRFCVIADEACLSKSEVQFFVSEIKAEVEHMAQDCLTLSKSPPVKWKRRSLTEAPDVLSV